MSSHLDEEEQLEAIKTWWDENRLLLIGTIVLTLMLTVGWQLWHQHWVREQGEAAKWYMTMVESKDPKAIQSKADALIENHADTPFATVAYFKKAQAYVVDKAYNKAEVMLKQVINDTDNEAFRAIAKLRLARIKLAIKQPDKAIAIVSGEWTSYFGWSDWVLGDCYREKGDEQKAVFHYKKALKALADNQIANTLISQQLMALPGDTYQGE